MTTLTVNVARRNSARKEKSISAAAGRTPVSMNLLSLPLAVLRGLIGGILAAGEGKRPTHPRQPAFSPRGAAEMAVPCRGGGITARRFRGIALLGARVGGAASAEGPDCPWVGARKLCGRQFMVRHPLWVSCARHHRCARPWAGAGAARVGRPGPGGRLGTASFVEVLRGICATRRCGEARTGRADRAARSGDASPPPRDYGLAWPQSRVGVEMKPLLALLLLATAARAEERIDTPSGPAVIAGEP